MRALALVGVVATFAALSGAAFACGYSGQCGGGQGGQGCQQQSGLAWVNPSSSTPGAAGVACTASFSGSTLRLAVTGLSPGTSCSFLGTLENTGSTALTLSDSVVATQPHTCRLFVYGDNLVGLATGPSLSGGHTFSYTAKISLGATAGNACENAAATFVVTVTGTASSSSPCEGFQYGLEYGPGNHNNCCH